MNILYCGDENIENGLLISVLSLLKNVTEELHIYVLTMKLKTESREYRSVSDVAAAYLDRRVKQENENSFVKKLDVTELFMETMPMANMETRFTPCCMLRLFVDQIPQMPDKILYLDNDVVCRRDCSRFYHQEMDGYELAGVLDHYGKWFFKNNPFHMDYLNSGVLLLNLAKIRKTGLFEQCRMMCREKKMFMPDQSALNKLSRHKKILPRRFNEQRKLHDDTVLQHFTTSFRFFPWLHTLTVKPWQVELVHEKLKLFEYDDILKEYADTVEIMKAV